MLQYFSSRTFFSVQFFFTSLMLNIHIHMMLNIHIDASTSIAEGYLKNRSTFCLNLIWVPNKYSNCTCKTERLSLYYMKWVTHKAKLTWPHKELETEPSLTLWCGEIQKVCKQEAATHPTKTCHILSISTFNTIHLHIHLSSIIILYYMYYKYLFIHIYKLDTISWTIKTIILHYHTNIHSLKAIGWEPVTEWHNGGNGV